MLQHVFHTHVSGFQLKNIIGYFWGRGSGHNMRDAVAFLLCHSGLLRGESARGMELPDLHSIELPSEGVTCCDVLVMVLLKVGFSIHINSNC